MIDTNLNVYRCAYRGNLGYGCRLRGDRWMFVPELYQRDARVHRNVDLEELVFADAAAREYERSSRRRGRGPVAALLRRLRPARRPITVGGMLFTAG